MQVGQLALPLRQCFGLNKFGRRSNIGGNTQFGGWPAGLYKSFKQLIIAIRRFNKYLRTILLFPIQLPAL